MMKKKRVSLCITLITSSSLLFGCTNRKLIRILSLPFQDNIVLISNTGLATHQGIARFSDLVTEGMRSKGLKKRDYQYWKRSSHFRVKDKIFINYELDENNNFIGFLDLDLERPLFSPTFHIPDMKFNKGYATDKYCFMFFDRAVYCFDSDLKFEKIDIDADDQQRMISYPGGLILRDRNQTVYSLDNSLTKTTLFQGTEETRLKEVIGSVLLYRNGQQYYGFDLITKQSIDDESVNKLLDKEEAFPYLNRCYEKNLTDPNSGETIFDFDEFKKTEPNAVFVQEELSTELNIYQFQEVQGKVYLQTQNNEGSFGWNIECTLPLVYEFNTVTHTTKYIGCLDSIYTSLYDVYQQNQ